MKREPVIAAAAVVAVIEAAIVMSVQLGWLDLTDPQLASVMTFVVALVAILAPLAGALVARRHTSPWPPLDDA